LSCDLQLKSCDSSPKIDKLIQVLYKIKYAQIHIHLAFPFQFRISFASTSLKIEIDKFIGFTKSDKICTCVRQRVGEDQVTFRLSEPRSIRRNISCLSELWRDIYDEAKQHQQQREEQ
jgi:hypothetical protein